MSSSSSSLGSQKRKLTPDYVQDSGSEDEKTEELAGSTTSTPSGLKAKKPNTSSREGTSPTKRVNDDGETYLELSGKRRVTVRKYKNNVLVDIREYWEPEPGKQAPGKKGISLTVGQWESLKSIMNDIDEAVEALKSSKK